MSNSHIDDVRRHLFGTLEGLRNKEDPMDIARARAVVDVAKALIDSAKVEVEYIRAAGADRSDFLEPKATALPPPSSGEGDPPPNGITGVRRHLMQG